MKKLVLSAILLLLIIAAAGCSRKEKNLATDDVSVNTMLAKSNGNLQVATVEDFDKTYYSLNELSEFVKKEIDSFNQKAGKDKVLFDDLKKRDDKAILLLSYPGMEQYSGFNAMPAAYFNGGTVDVSSLKLPDTLVAAGNGSMTNTEEVIKNEKYKVLVVFEPYDIIVDGKIKYYSDNAVLSKSNKLQSANEGMTVVVYKP